MNFKVRQKNCHSPFLRQKLSIGTAQFGLDYGITNTSGKVPYEEVRDLIDFYKESLQECGELENSALVFDTAQDYGDAEVVLGTIFEELKIAANKSKIITKFSLEGDHYPTYESFVRSINGSKVKLGHLESDKLYGLLFHHGESLLSKDGERVFQFLKRYKDEGLVKKIGASFYSPGELVEVLERFDLDLIQVPFNVLDQRFGSLELQKIYQEKNLEVHVRSLFLQGLFHLPWLAIPAHLRPIKLAMRKWQSWLQEEGLSVLEGIGHFLKTNSWVDQAVFGFCYAWQLEELLMCFDKIENLPREFDKGHLFSSFALGKESDMGEYLSPANWDKLKKQYEKECNEREQISEREQIIFAEPL